MKSKKSKYEKSVKGDAYKSEKSVSKSKSKEKEKDKDKDKYSKGKDKESKYKSPSKKEKGKDSKAPKGSKYNPFEGSYISQPIIPPADCIHHKSPFINFCETCEELVCNQCTVYGPHNNHLHRILKMTDAYRLRKYYLVYAIRSNLVDKRDKMIAQLHRLYYRIEEIRFVKSIIERDIRSEYAGILERLKSFEGVKLAKLTHEVSLTQREIDTINDIGNQFFQLTNMDCDQVEQAKRRNQFLARSKQMYYSVEYLIARPVKQLPDLRLEEMPKYVEENRAIRKKIAHLPELNTMKNYILWNLLLGLRSYESTVKRYIELKASEIIKYYSSYVYSLSYKLVQFKMICHFCGYTLNGVNVNNACSANNSQSIATNIFATKTLPYGKHIGNHRHYFSRPAPQ